MKVVIICAVTGNLPVVKECMESWFPLPDNWELYMYKSKFTTIDGTDKYIEKKKNDERGVTIIEDGEHRGHVPALEILFDTIKNKNFDWVIHLDTDAKLLNRDFYSWANKSFAEEKYKVWGKVHSRASSKIQARSNDPFFGILYLLRAHSWLLMAEIKFLVDNDINFNDLRIDGVVSPRTYPPKTLKTNKTLNPGDKLLIFGDTGWQLYTEASRIGLYQDLPDNIYKMWHHKNNQTEIWKKNNLDILRKTFKK